MTQAIERKLCSALEPACLDAIPVLDDPLALISEKLLCREVVVVQKLLGIVLLLRCICNTEDNVNIRLGSKKEPRNWTNGKTTAGCRSNFKKRGKMAPWINKFMQTQGLHIPSHVRLIRS
jgi:hypothetical protein